MSTAHTTEETTMNTAPFTPRYTHDAATLRGLEALESDLLRHADRVDALAARVKDWDLSPRMALGIIEEADELATTATRLYLSDLIGPSTKASYRNEASAVGGTNGYSGRGRGSIARALMYALGEVEKYRTGQYQGDDDTAMARSTLAVKASSMRCHASSCRVVASIAHDVATGKYASIG